ncbi:RIP metalloprotease RseP [Coraliomargarita sinensis]|uniref:RIP metalloprotease RseP n=1 Tax=Coraliomargarita sinensis TaxID=2174842 RepID=A0A317ZFD1_9BACT|nr:site-2 protease family protein [Coraliomargarita sinensis]PXA04176.1 RIP metalloprotease RseP [Coraliomargarita sinensis]
MLLDIFYVAVAIFALGFCIFIHELGHFIAAKKRGLVADRFSVGFGPRLFGWKWKGTDFRVSLIPLGGYVSLPQLVDMGRLEGGDGEEADKLPPISYADKMIVAVMGAVFNLIFAFILSLVLWGVGREIVKSTEVGSIAEQIVTSERETVPGPALQAGIQLGDTIVSVDGQRIGSWMQFQNALMTGTGRSDDGRAMAEIGVIRDGEPMSVTVYPQTITSEEIRHIGVYPTSDENAAPLIVRLEKDMPAYKAGLKEGDRILKLDGEAVASGGFLSAYLASHGDRSIEITVDRDGRELVIPVKPRIKKGETSPRFGFQYDYPFKKERVHYNPIEQMGIFANTMRMTLFALLHTESDVKVKNMSGPVGIVHGLSRMAQFGVIDLVWFLALINVNLAIFNLLPIPVLDGGHMLFATISKIIGRPLPIPVMEKVQGAFMVLLLGMVLYITFFDVGRVGRDIGLIEDETVTAKEEEPTTETAPNPAP